MSSCQKCGGPLQGDELECPKCGVLLNKVRPTRKMTPAGPMVVAVPRPNGPAAPLTPEPARQSTPVSSATASASEISPATLKALESMRPYLRILVIVGAVSLLLGVPMILSGLAQSNGDPDQTMATALFYGFLAIVGLVSLVPLNGASSALNRMHAETSRATVEKFIVMQASYWRLMAIAMLVLVILLGLAIAGTATGSTQNLLRDLSGG